MFSCLSIEKGNNLFVSSKVDIEKAKNSKSIVNQKVITCLKKVYTVRLSPVNTVHLNLDRKLDTFVLVILT